MLDGLEVDSENHLELPIGSGAHLIGHGRRQSAKVATGSRGRVRLTGLENAGCIR
jgi:hypothetical protein